MKALLTLASLTCLTVSLTASANESACAKVTLSGTYACSFEGEAVTLTIERRKDSFTIATQMAGEREDRETYVADGVRRQSEVGTGRIDEYVASCVKNSLQVTQYVGNEAQATASLVLARTPKGLVWTIRKFDRQSGAQLEAIDLECAKSQARR